MQFDVQTDVVYVHGNINYTHQILENAYKQKYSLKNP